MATSQNGWPIITDPDLLDERPVAGVTFPNGVRLGDVATVLHYLAEQFHERVEHLHAGWCWGWYIRRIEGSTAYSNHSSGTAIDLNAPDHPLGASGTFTAAQEARIGAILLELEGVVRWGGRYSGRKDEMHFEIIKGAAVVSAVANKIRSQSMAAVDLTPAAVDLIWADVMGGGPPSNVAAKVMLDRIYKAVTDGSGSSNELFNRIEGIETTLNALGGKLDAIKSALESLTHDPADGGTTTEQEGLAAAVWQAPTRTLTA